jgi:hypothetical protein
MITWQFFQVLTYELTFKNIYHTNLTYFTHTQQYQLVCGLRPIPVAASICGRLFAGIVGTWMSVS